MLTSNALVSQESDDWDFLDEVNQQFPNYRLVYVNDNYQINYFTLFENRLTLLLSSGNAPNIETHFLLLDATNNSTLDTITFKKTNIDYGQPKHFYYNSGRDIIYFRPSFGELNNLSFYENLTFEIPVLKNRFGEPVPHFDKTETKHDSLIPYFLKQQNLNVATGKTITLLIDNKKTASYKEKNIKDRLKQKRTYSYRHYFPHVITQKQLIVLDILGEQLVFANQASVKKQQLTNLSEITDNQAKYELLYDEGYDDLYFKANRKSGESQLYKLMGNEFKELDIKLPKSWNNDGSNITRSTPTFINSGKLYTIIEIEENGRLLDAIFMTIL